MVYYYRPTHQTWMSTLEINPVQILGDFSHPLVSVHWWMTHICLQRISVISRNRRAYVWDIVHRRS